MNALTQLGMVSEVPSENQTHDIPLADATVTEGLLRRRATA